MPSKLCNAVQLVFCDVTLTGGASSVVELVCTISTDKESDFDVLSAETGAYV